MIRKNNSFIETVKNINFIKLWISQILAYLGSRITQFAILGWLIANTNHAGEGMGFITFFELLPAFLFGQFAGILNDKFSRKKIMVFSDVTRVIIMFSMAMIINTGAASSSLFYLIVFLMGLCTSFVYPAKLAMLPNLVKKEQLQTANSLISGTGTIATLLGTYFSSFLFERISFHDGFIMNCIGFIISAILVFSIKSENFSETNAVSINHQITHNDFNKLKNYLITHNKVKDLILLAILLSAFCSTFYIGLTVLTINYLKLGSSGFARLLTMLGSGMILGSIIPIYFKNKIKPNILLISSFLVIGITNLTANLVTNYSLAWVWLTLIGASNAVIMIVLDTVLQQITPNSYRGKLFGFKYTVTNGAFLISILITTQYLKFGSPLALFKILSFTSFAVALIILLYNRDVIYNILHVLMKYLLKTFFKLEIQGLEHLNKHKGHVILAGNHTGFLDVPILMSASNRYIRFLAAEAVFSWAIVGWVMQRGGVIPVSKGKGKDALSDAIAFLKGSNAVGIFPEGKLTTDGRLGNFHKGVAVLHKKTGAPIIPFAIHGGYEAWGWQKSIPNLNKLTIQFGEAIQYTEFDEVKITEEVRSRVENMKESLDRRERLLSENDYQKSVLSLMQMKSDNRGTNIALSVKENDSWEDLSYVELSRQSKKLASTLIENGVQPKDRIAILCESRPEWGIGFFGGIRAGGILVPLDIKLTIKELSNILLNSAPSALLISSDFIETAVKLQSDIKSIKNIIVLDKENIGFKYPSLKELKIETIQNSIERSLDETALTIYTSGTTGSPKGVMISFENLIFEMRNVELMLDLKTDELFLSILPLNHLLELTGGFLGVLHAGARVCYSKKHSPSNISSIMCEKHITYMITVPLMLKLLKDSIEKKISKLHYFQRNYFKLRFFLARFISCKKIRKMFFLSIHKQFGGKLKGFVCGGAPLDIETEMFFRNIGISVYQGYGLTETSPVISVNTPKHNRIGSVGKPLPGVIVRILNQDQESNEGEIIVKGPNVMKGYYENISLTDEVIDQGGWFHTGDIGKFDQDGFLYITGRIKNLIVLYGGKKVHPEEVEDVLSKGNLIKEICVLGRTSTDGLKEGTEEVCAVVVPKDLAHGKESEVLNEIDFLAKNLASYKRPSKIFIRNEELPKTSTNKFKRKEIEEWVSGQQIKED